MHNLEDILKDASTKIVYLSKSSLIQRVGEKTNKSYFVKKGLLRGYTIDEKGKEHIFMFAPEGWIISDIESHTLSSLSVLYIDALEDSEVVVFNRNQIDTSKMSKDIILAEFRRLLKRVGVLQRRVIMQMSASALNRYEHFLETYPQIVHRVPQRMIASYLGITPEALSKIRAESLRKK